MTKFLLIEAKGHRQRVTMQAVKIEEKTSRDTKIEYFCVPCWFLYAPLFIPSSFKIEDFNQATKCA